MIRTSLVLSVATLTVVLSGLSAHAKTVKSTNPRAVDSVAKPIPGKAATSASVLLAQPSEMAQTNRTPEGAPTPGTIPGTITPGYPTPGTTPGTITPGTTPGTIPDQIPPGTNTPEQITPNTLPITPTPDTTTPDTTTPRNTTPDNTTPRNNTPDSNGISPGGATLSGPSYFGIGANIGLGTGDTALGDASFAVFSKIGLTRNFSVRPNLFISDDTTLLIPITYDLGFIPVPGAGGLGVAPYLGAGAAVSFGDDTSADFLLSAGLDVPLSRRLTATAAVNVTPLDNAAVGLLIGIGYNFPGL